MPERPNDGRAPEPTLQERLHYQQQREAERQHQRYEEHQSRQQAEREARRRALADMSTCRKCDTPYPSDCRVDNDDHTEVYCPRCVVGLKYFQVGASWRSEPLTVTERLVWKQLVGMSSVAPVEQPPPQPAPSSEPVTIRFHGGQSYSIEGKTPKAVSREQHHALSEFLDRDEARTTSELAKVVSNVARVMDKLDRAFPGAIRKPGGRGDGYYLRVRTVSTT